MQDNERDSAKLLSAGWKLARITYAMLKTFLPTKRLFALPEEASAEGGQQSLKESEPAHTGVASPRAKCKSLSFLACPDAKKVMISVARKIAAVVRSECSTR